MIKKIEALFNKLGEWNHAAFAIVLVPVIGWLFGGLFFHAAFTVLWGYYNREVSSNGSYNPMKWIDHDYKQSGILFIATPVIAVICDIIYKAM